jgi:1-deoxy-D-xylulose-5-phosphate reductoisomerase
LPASILEIVRLEFFTPRYGFSRVKPARRAGTGGTLPAVMNAANEVTVAGFLDRQVRFPDIWQIVEEVMNRHTSVAHPDLDAILQADQWARKEARGMLDR